jgi:hypothetical protein
MTTAVDVEALGRAIAGLEPELRVLYDAFLEALAADRVREDIPSNHSPHFAPVQDRTVAAGIEAMDVAARQWL